MNRSEAEKLIERLREPMWSHGPSDDAHLDAETTIADMAEAADAIAAQEVELATKEEQRRFADDAARQSFEKLSASLAEAERLRKALEPFAKEAVVWAGYDDTEPLTEGWRGGPPTTLIVAHLRTAAREALAIPTDVSGAGQ